MNNSISIFNIILLFGLATAFVQFENNIEYEFQFKSKFDLSPAFLGGGQLVNATLLARKFGTDGSSLVVRIKDSVARGANINSESKSNIEGVFGIKRQANGEITHIISKSNGAKGVLTKKSIVALLADDFSFFSNYLNSSNKNQQTEHRVALSIGWCNSNITAVADADSGLTKVLAQSEKQKCEVNQLVLMAGQLLLHGTTDQIGEVKDDSNAGLSVIFNSVTGRILEVSKFTFLNLVVAGVEVQARHNMILDYVGEHAVTSETDFNKPYYAFSNNDIDNFIRDH